jgi:hypothetical protein
MRRAGAFVVNGGPDFLDIVRVLLQAGRYDGIPDFVPRSSGRIAGLQPAPPVIDPTVGARAGRDASERLHTEARIRKDPGDGRAR